MQDVIAESDRLYEESLVKQRELITAILNSSGSFLDEDGYPTDSGLKIVEHWPSDDPHGWFNFIHKLWAYTSWGWNMSRTAHEYREDRYVDRYKISTAGWSGNERVVEAMSRNILLWHITWVQSRRGGHHIFDIEVENTNNV
jgi:hypothetical protein